MELTLSDLLNKIGGEYSLWKKHKKAKRYGVAREFKGRLEMLLELYCLLGGAPNDCNTLTIIFKEVRGF